MTKVYYRKYKERIDDGEITLEEAIELVRTEVPARWQDDVIRMLEEALLDRYGVEI